ncbi:MAG: hypothetical protein J6328_03315 [Bacilli bacterium]|nr:hypothetical protein [Bacilli bacterium]
MNKACLFVSLSAGTGVYARHKKKILDTLRPLFDELEVVEAIDLSDGEKAIKELGEDVRTLLIVGGDGTFYQVINWLYLYGKKPLIAYINGGTLGDVGKNFGISKNLHRALKVIKDGHLSSFDIVKVGEKVFAYMGAVGSYSDVSYKVDGKKKKRLGRLSYYFLSFREAFKGKRIHVAVEYEGRTIEADVPFLLLLNGRNVGGFRINKKGSIQDGKLEVYLPKPGLFNGLLPFFLSPNKVERISLSKAHIRLDSSLTWCFDGEEGGRGDLDVEVLPSAFQIYSSSDLR